MNKIDRIKRLQNNGYKVFHIIKDFYFVRKYGKSKKFSTYHIKKIK